MKIKLVLRKDCDHRVDVFNDSGEAIAVLHVDDFISDHEPLEKLKKGEAVILTDGIDNDIYKKRIQS